MFAVHTATGLRHRWARRSHSGNARGGPESAQSLVEFAIITPLFFLLMFGVMDLGRLFFTQMTLQHAMREGGRFGVTGNKLADPANPGSYLSRVNSIKHAVRKAAAGLAVDPQSIRILPAGSAADAPDSAGGPGQTFTISLTYNLRLITPLVGRFFPNQTHTFTVNTTFRNEPFDPSQAT